MYCLQVLGSSYIGRRYKLISTVAKIRESEEYLVRYTEVFYIDGLKTEQVLEQQFEFRLKMKSVLFS